MYSEYQIIHYIKKLPDQIRLSVDSKNYQIKVFLFFECRLSLKANSLLPKRKPSK